MFWSCMPRFSKILLSVGWKAVFITASMIHNFACIEINKSGIIIYQVSFKRSYLATLQPITGEGRIMTMGTGHNHPCQ